MLFSGSAGFMVFSVMMILWRRWAERGVAGMYPCRHPMQGSSAVVSGRPGSARRSRYVPMQASAAAVCMLRAERDVQRNCCCVHAAGHNMALLLSQARPGSEWRPGYLLSLCAWPGRAWRPSGDSVACARRAARTPRPCVQVTSAAAICGRAAHGVAGTCHSGNGCCRRCPAGRRVSSQVMCPGVLPPGCGDGVRIARG